MRFLPIIQDRQPRGGAGVAATPWGTPTALWSGAGLGNDAPGGGATVFTSASRQKARKEGVALSVSGTSALDRAVLRCGRADDIGAGDFTVIQRFVYVGGGGGYATLGRWNTGGSAGSNDWYIGANNSFASSGVGFVVECGSTTYTASAAGSWAADTEYILVGRRRGTTIFVDRFTPSTGALVSASTTNAGITTVNYNAARKLKPGEIDIAATNNADIDTLAAAIFRRALGGAELKALFSAFWQLFPPERRIWVPVLAGGITGPVSRADEADSALGLSGTLVGSVGLAQGTAAALGLGGTLRGSVGLAVEANATFTLTGKLRGAAGVAAETVVALALSQSQSGAVGLAEEADTALGRSGILRGSVGIAIDAETASALTGKLRGSGGAAAGTATALALTGKLRGAAGVAAETDAALALLPPATGVGVAAETGAALSLAGVMRGMVGVAADTEAVLALAARMKRLVGAATSSEIALPLRGRMCGAMGLANELDSALALSLAGGGTGNCPSAAEIAAAVRAALAPELAMIAELLARPESPSAGDTAAAVWAHLSRTLTSAPPPTPEEIAQAIWNYDQ